jgi:hypothetical protein
VLIHPFKTGIWISHHGDSRLPYRRFSYPNPLNFPDPRLTSPRPICNSGIQDSKSEFGNRFPFHSEACAGDLSETYQVRGKS